MKILPKRKYVYHINGKTICSLFWQLVTPHLGGACNDSPYLFFAFSNCLRDFRAFVYD